MKEPILKMVWIIINLFVLEQISLRSGCGCEKIKKQVEYKEIGRNMNQFRNLEEIPWEPIRIHIDDTHINSLGYYVPYVTILDIIEGMYRVKSVVESLIMVKRETKPLVIPYCYGQNLQEIITSTGVDADFIISLGIDFTLKDSIVAQSYSCGFELKNRRPVGGVIDLNPKFFKSSAIDKIDYLIIKTLHEMLHLLAFNQDYLQNFSKEDGTKIPIGEIIKYKFLRGKHVKMISTPKVVEAARKHFNCSLLEGVEIEDLVDDNLNYLNWESRIMNGDIMDASIAKSKSISGITLAFMEDTGWYKTNYYTGGLFQFGKNRGCSFITEKCIENGTTKFKNEFPITEIGEDIFCTSNRRGRGKAFIRTIDVKNIYQYFEDPFLGGDDLADFCPVPVKESDQNFIDAFSCLDGNSDIYPHELGEIISKYSHCFYSSLFPKDETELRQHSSTRAMCHQVSCDYSTKTYTVKIGSSQVECGLVNTSKTVDGYKGNFECADFNLICYQEIECSDLVDCVLKKSKINETEICPPEYFYNEQIRQCVVAIDCPENTFGDLVTKFCVILSMCDSSTPFGDFSSKNCVDAKSCPDGYYGDIYLKLCVSKEECVSYDRFIDPSLKLCSFECSNSNPYLDISNNWCVSSSGCSSSNQFADPSTFTCKSLCERDKNVLGKICIQKDGRCPENTFKFQNECFRNCPNENLVIDFDLRECIDCSLNGQYFYNNQCWDVCPMPTIPDPSRANICVDCYLLGLLWYENDCVNECPENYYPNFNNICISINGKFLIYVWEGKVVDFCPDGYVSDENGICYQCISKKKYWLEAKCVDMCPLEKVIYKYACTDCKSLNLKKFRNKCVETCPMNSIETGGVSCDCPEYLKFSQLSFECVKECPNKMGYLEELYMCVFCEYFNMFIFNGVCLEICPERTFSNEIEKKCEIINFLNFKFTNIPNSCETNPCLNSGKCVLSDSVISCDCLDGYFGKICQYKTEELVEISNKFSSFFSYLKIRLYTSDIRTVKANLNTYYLLLYKYPDNFSEETIISASKEVGNVLLKFIKYFSSIRYE
jgi:hypothetical protein